MSANFQLCDNMSDAKDTLKHHLLRILLTSKCVAEVFGRVFVLTGISIKGGGVIKYKRRRREPLGGYWDTPARKF